MGTMPHSRSVYAERAVGRRGGNAAVFRVLAVHITAQSLVARTGKGVWYGHALSFVYGRRNIEGTGQSKLHHVDAPGNLGYLHFSPLAHFHTYTHGIRAYAHVGRDINRVRAACGHIACKRAGIGTLGYRDSDTSGITGTFAGRGVYLVVLIYQLHLVPLLDGTVRGNTGKNHFGCRYRTAATATRELVRGTEDFALLAQEGNGKRLVIPLPYLVQQESRAVCASEAFQFRGNTLAAHRIGRVLVHRLVHLNNRYIQGNHPLSVRNKFLRGSSFRYPDFLYGVTSPEAFPCGRLQPVLRTCTPETVILPFAGRHLERDNHSRLVRIIYVGIRQSCHGGFLRIVSLQGVHQRNVIKTVSGTSSTRFYKGSLSCAPNIQDLVTEISFVFQYRSPGSVHVNICSVPVIVKHGRGHAADEICEHFLALDKHDGTVIAHIACRGYMGVIHKTCKPGGGTVQCHAILPGYLFRCCGRLICPGCGLAGRSCSGICGILCLLCGSCCRFCLGCGCLRLCRGIRCGFLQQVYRN